MLLCSFVREQKTRTFIRDSGQCGMAGRELELTEPPAPTAGSCRERELGIGMDKEQSLTGNPSLNVPPAPSLGLQNPVFQGKLLSGSAHLAALVFCCQCRSSLSLSFPSKSKEQQDPSVPSRCVQSSVLNSKSGSWA